MSRALRLALTWRAFLRLHYARYHRDDVFGFRALAPHHALRLARSARVGSLYVSPEDRDLYALAQLDPEPLPLP